MADWDPAVDAGADAGPRSAARFDFHGKRWWEVQQRLVAKWRGVYELAAAQRWRRGVVVVVDGPPFSNGDIHVGHALNKICKDTLAKVHRMQGRRVVFLPGADSHGLPIELRAQHELGAGEHSAGELLPRCRAIVAESIAAQTRSFQRLGVIADFDRQWSTADAAYEALTLRAFAQLLPHVSYEQHLINWCPSCRTPLSNSEVEPHELAIAGSLVLFPVVSRLAVAAAFGLDAPPPDSAVVGLLVWTTAVWSLRFSQALLVAPGADYCLAELAGRRLVIVGRDAAERLGMRVVATAPARALAAAQLSAHCPVAPQHCVPVAVSHHVRTSKGTGVLHCAPCCGLEDYACARQLFDVALHDVFDQSGRFVHSPHWPELAGLDACAASAVYAERLRADALLCHDDSVAAALQAEHSVSRVPCCWRCAGRIVCRASYQYFLDIADALQSLHCDNATTFLPAACRASFAAALRSRPGKWLLSRNRAWGVPIAAHVCDACCTAALAPELPLWLADETQRRGGVAFWAAGDADAEAAQRFPQLMRCAHCAAPTRRETMTLDVFFESALTVGHTFACAVNNDDNEVVDDVVLIEGPDQQRGFFACTAIAAALLPAHCPRPTVVLQHSFVVQDDGRKFSKSRPQLDSGLPDSLQTDVLRVLMLAGMGHRPELRISHDDMYRAFHRYKKVRACLGHAANFLLDAAHVLVVPVAALPLAERLVLSRLHAVAAAVAAALDRRDFARAFNLTADYVLDLRASCFAQWFAERPSPTLLAVLLHTVVRLVAPFYSFFADELYEFIVEHASWSFAALPGHDPASPPPCSVHLCLFVNTGETLTVAEKQPVAQLTTLAARYLAVAAQPPPKLLVHLLPDQPAAVALAELERQHTGITAFLLSSARRLYRSDDVHVVCSPFAPDQHVVFTWPAKQPWLQFISSQ